MKIPKGFKMPKVYNSNPKKVYPIKLQWFLYGLKQSRSIWYNHISEYLFKGWYNNDLIYPWVFIKMSKCDFAIIVVYVDYLNIIRTLGEIPKTINY
jgi:hypothetical protein